MATPTLANPSNPHHLFADTARLFAPALYPKSQPEFLVFPTGQPQYHWCVVASATNRTVSLHNSLPLALRKCTRLNKQRGKGARNATE